MSHSNSWRSAGLHDLNTDEDMETLDAFMKETSHLFEAENLHNNEQNEQVTVSLLDTLNRARQLTDRLGGRRSAKNEAEIEDRLARLETSVSRILEQIEES